MQPRDVTLAFVTCNFPESLLSPAKWRDKAPSKFLLNRPIHLVLCSVRGPVIDAVPVVHPGVQTSFVHLAEQLIIPVSHWCESDIRAHFDDRLKNGTRTGYH